MLGQIYDEIFPNETERERILKRLPRAISNVLSSTVSDLSCSRFTSLVIGNTKAAELHGVLNQWISKRQRSLLLSPKFQPEINLRSRDLNRPDPVHLILHSKGEEYERKKEKERERLQEIQMQGCTFKPKLNLL